MPPLALTDDQITQVLRCAAPLTSADRSNFLRDVAAELAGKELGDGLVLRSVAKFSASIGAHRSSGTTESIARNSRGLFRFQGSP
jgi:hypothetical protein